MTAASDGDPSWLRWIGLEAARGLVASVVRAAGLGALIALRIGVVLILLTVGLLVGGVWIAWPWFELTAVGGLWVVAGVILYVWREPLVLRPIRNRAAQVVSHELPVPDCGSEQELDDRLWLERSRLILRIGRVFRS